MAAASGERAPAFTAQELEKLVDGVLPQYTLLYVPPDQQVSAHQKRDISRAIAKEVRTLGAHQRRGTHCHKRWEDIRRCSKKTAEAQLGMASQRGRSARHTMTPLMFRILAVAYPELDGRLRASQQTQGESAVTPPKVGKGQRKSAQPVVSVTAEKCAIISGGRDTTASTVVTGPETTARVIAQEGPSIVIGKETTAGVTAQKGTSIVTGQETTARVTAQEGTSIVTGQETTAGVTAQEGTSIVTGQETTARVIAQEGTSIVTGQETTTTTGVTAQEDPGCHSPGGL
ncbi:hypothetical protein NDU88_005718 [Pleurodeles waltl]|uniref:Myb/SANT-like DNA-binding domain-containing protein n=1 Tax=Pleurodeles waltl TaxID=8319 RepID=A0AAV7RQ14_PLEWA|nr:hypothetical protein NDU88_005718 [Pleurodeles waltl]